MKVLVAEDDPVSRRYLEKRLMDWGYDTVCAADGQEAWDLFQKGNFQLLITDWMMPGVDGLELIRRVRAARLPSYIYIIILTSKASKQEVVEGMRTGADDFITKPFDRDELHVRIKAGERILNLEAELVEKIGHIKTLQGLLPICMHCKKIRSDDHYWTQVEDYLSQRTDVRFTHGLCPECLEKYYPEDTH
jgi:DNA-binding response OmpR family regulator